MKSEKFEILVGWEPLSAGLSSEEGWVAAYGKLSLGTLDTPDDDEPTFHDEKISVGAIMKDGRLLACRDGGTSMMEHHVTRKSIVGEYQVNATDREIHELAMYVLADHDLRDHLMTSMEVEITEVRADHTDALLTVAFQGHNEQKSAFFTVDVHTKGWSEYGCDFVGGETDIHPESFMEETVHCLCRQFYPEIDM